MLRGVLSRVLFLLTLYRKSTFGSTPRAHRFPGAPSGALSRAPRFPTAPSKALFRALPTSRLAPLWLAGLIAMLYIIWIQKGFTAEPPKNDSGANFQGNDSDSGPKVGVTGRKSELRTKSRRYSRADPQNPNQIAQKRAPNGV